MLKSILFHQEKLARLKHHTQSTKNLLSIPNLTRDNPGLFFQAREQLEIQERLLKQVDGNIHTLQGPEKHTHPLDHKDTHLAGPTIHTFNPRSANEKI